MKRNELQNLGLVWLSPEYQNQLQLEIQNQKAKLLMTSDSPNKIKSETSQEMDNQITYINVFKDDSEFKEQDHSFQKLIIKKYQGKRKKLNIKEKQVKKNKEYLKKNISASKSNVKSKKSNSKSKTKFQVIEKIESNKKDYFTLNKDHKYEDPIEKQMRSLKEKYLSPQQLRKNLKLFEKKKNTLGKQKMKEKISKTIIHPPNLMKSKSSSKFVKAPSLHRLDQIIFSEIKKNHEKKLSMQNQNNEDAMNEYFGFSSKLPQIKQESLSLKSKRKSILSTKCKTQSSSHSLKKGVSFKKKNFNKAK